MGCAQQGCPCSKYSQSTNRVCIKQDRAGRTEAYRANSGDPTSRTPSLILRINFFDPNINTVLAVNVGANVANLWSNIATLDWPYGLAGPVGGC